MTFFTQQLQRMKTEFGGHVEESSRK